MFTACNDGWLNYFNLILIFSPTQGNKTKRNKQGRINNGTREQEKATDLSLQSIILFTCESK